MYDYDLRGFENWLYEEELSANTIDGYMRGVKIFFRRYKELNKENLIDFKKWLSETHKPKTVNNRLTAVMKYSIYKGDDLKVKHVKEQKKSYIDNVITPEQVTRLLEGLKRDGKARMYYYVILLSKTGMRISEALSIRKKDILKGEVTIPAKAHMRTIYFPKKLQEEITPLLNELDDDDVVMQNIYGEPLTSRGFAELLIRYGTKYGIPRNVLHAHAFRHYFAIQFAKRNTNMALLADLLGHGSVNVTQIYLRMSQEEQRAALDKAVDW